MCRSIVPKKDDCGDENNKKNLNFLVVSPPPASADPIKKPINTFIVPSYDDERHVLSDCFGHSSATVRRARAEVSF